MKAISLLIISVFLFSLGTGVLAQKTELPSPGLTPDSPFYFLERISEAIGTFFTFGDLKKAERYATLAAERLAEVQAVVEKGKPEFAEKTLQRYENQLNNSIARAKKAQAKNKNTEKVMARVGKATFKHLKVLAEVYEKVPEQAKPAIEKAMKASVRGHEKAVEVLKAQNALGNVPEVVSLPVEVPVEARERIKERVRQESEVEKMLESFKSFGSLRAFCIEKGGSPEACEIFPLQGFKSFEPLEAFCTEQGGPPEICASIEAKCKEFGVTTPDECFIIFFTATTKTISAPSLSEEEMEERGRKREESGTSKFQTPEEIVEIPIEELKCEFNEVIFYYSDTSGLCQKVKDDGIIEKIEELGVKVNQVDVAIEPIQHQLSGIPTFVIGEKVYFGYKTFKQIKDLLGCQ